MANPLSPGIYIQEVDVSNIVPTVSNNTAFFAGNFDRGPLDQPYVVTTLNELETVFGYPTDRNYNEWFQCAKYLDYANQLVISRGFEDTDMTLTPSLNDARQRLFVTYADATATDYVALSDLIDITTSTNFAFEYGIGDWISLGTYDILYEITNITTIPANASAPGGPVPKLAKVTLQTVGGVDGTATIPASTDVFIHSIRHLNGGTQALAKGTVTNGIPDAPVAVSADNVDFNDTTADYGVKRFAYSYNLIKNKEEWDYFNTQTTNPLATFMNNAKLKFFNKTANTDKVEIAIASPDDFVFINGENFAIAFTETLNGNTSNIYLASLFSYYPQEGEIAIALKQGSKIESYIVSFDPLSVDGNNRSNYIETVINDQSTLVYVIDNKSVDDIPASYLVTDRYGWATDTSGKVLVGTPAPNGVATTNLYSMGGRSPRIGKGALRDAYFTVEDKELYEIDVVIGNEFVDGDYDNQNYAIELADSRKDCIAFIGARYVDTVKKKAAEATKNIISYLLETDVTKRGQSVKPNRTMFAAFFANYLKIYDKYNKKSRYINCAGDAAGIRCQVSGVQDAWWVSAGERRGVLKNIDRLAFTPSQAQRDNLYKNGINPIVSFPGSGNLIWGNKTLHPLASSFDRINVRTLFNILERSAAKSARSQVFEFNDAYTRNAILSMFSPYLASIKSARGIVDYLVVCDETNNTPDIISRNELKVDIYIKPTYAAEMITLSFTNVGTRSFSSVVGA